MRIVLTGVAALLAGTSTLMAGGIERAPQSLNALFEEGNYVELSFGGVDPTVRGTDAAGFSTGDVAQGYGFAAYVRQGTVLSVGAVLRQPEGDWQLAGVRTLDAHTGQGYATAVSSFITHYIVNERGRAVCELDSQDAAMRHILEKLGFQLLEEPGDGGETGG